MYVTDPPGGASCVRRPGTPPVVDVITCPGKTIETFPAAAGSALFSVTVTVAPAVTINVGPGSCIEAPVP